MKLDIDTISEGDIDYGDLLPPPMDDLIHAYEYAKRKWGVPRPHFAATRYHRGTKEHWIKWDEDHEPYDLPILTVILCDVDGNEHSTVEFVNGRISTGRRNA